MSNWLNRLLSPPDKGKSRNLPSLNLARELLPSQLGAGRPSEKLPQASLMYGIAAGGLLAIALYFLFTGSWITGILLLLPAACFLGYALYFIKYQD